MGKRQDELKGERDFCCAFYSLQREEDRRERHTKGDSLRVYMQVSSSKTALPLRDLMKSVKYI